MIHKLWVINYESYKPLQYFEIFCNNAKLFKRRECNNCWEAQPNRPLLHSRRLNNDHYIKTFSVIRCNNHHYCKKFCPKIAIFRNFCDNDDCCNLQRTSKKELPESSMVFIFFEMFCIYQTASLLSCCCLQGLNSIPQRPR